MRGGLAGLLLVFVSTVAMVGQGAGRTLAFTLNREGPPPLEYTLEVAEDGTGTYRLGPQTDASETRHIQVGPALVKKLFAAIPMVEGGRCETHSKGIAKTGVKVLQFHSGPRNAQCTYNYSDDDRVNQATDAFEGIAETMQSGERLRAKLRFDRLGLDAELEQLQGEVAEGRALEVGNIAPVLQTIVADERVMDRARRKAERLMETTGPAQAAVPGAGSSPR